MADFDKAGFADLLRRAMGNRSINQYAHDSGVSATYISKLLRELIQKSPGYLVLEKLSDHAHADVSYIDFARACGYPTVSNRLEKHLAQSPSNHFADSLEHTSPLQSDVAKPQFINLPTYGTLSLALLEQDSTGEIETPIGALETGKRHFWYQVQHDNMAPNIKKDDLVLIRMQEAFDYNDQTVVVRVEDEHPSLTRIHQSKSSPVLWLKPDNPYFPERGFGVNERSHVSILGVALELRRRNP